MKLSYAHPSSWPLKRSNSPCMGFTRWVWPAPIASPSRTSAVSMEFAGTWFYGIADLIDVHTTSLMVANTSRARKAEPLGQAKHPTPAAVFAAGR